MPFTQPPWAMVTEEDGRMIVYGAADAPGEVEIAQVLGAEDFPCADDEELAELDIECAANGRLIVKAPELYRLVWKLRDAMYAAVKFNAPIIDPAEHVLIKEADELLKEIDG